MVGASFLFFFGYPAPSRFLYPPLTQVECFSPSTTSRSTESAMACPSTSQTT
jgi:hypothetical protein